MTHISTTDNIADNEFETAITDDAWSAEPADDGTELRAGGVGKPQRQQSALRSIEERRELEELDFANGRLIEPD